MYNANVALTKFKEAEQRLLANEYIPNWLYLTKQCLKYNIRLTRAQVAAKFLMGTETVDLAKHNIILAGIETVLIDSLLIEHKELCYMKRYCHYFKATLLQ